MRGSIGYYLLIFGTNGRLGHDMRFAVNGEDQSLALNRHDESILKLQWDAARKQWRQPKIVR